MIGDIFNQFFGEEDMDPEAAKKEGQNKKGMIYKIALALRNGVIPYLGGLDSDAEKGEDNSFSFQGKEVLPVNIMNTTKDGRLILRRSMVCMAKDDEGTEFFYFGREMMHLDLTPYLDLVIKHEGDIEEVMKEIRGQKKLTE